MNLLITKCFLGRFGLLLANPIQYQFANLKAKPNKKPQVTFTKWNIVRGDVVKIIAGKDKTKIGEVTRVWRKTNKITVRGVNIKIKRVRTPETGVTVGKRKAYPIHLSNAGLYDSQAKKAVRVRYGFHPQSGEKLRISKASGKILKKPTHKNLTRERRGKKKNLGKKDTTSEFAHKVTYDGQDFEIIKRQFEQFIAEKQQKEKYLVFKQ